MRVHLLALPNAQTTEDYPLCGFTVCTRRFAALLKSIGATVILYGAEKNTAPCDEFVSTITKEEQDLITGEIPYQLAVTGTCLGLWQLSNGRMIKEIAKRKQAQDIICVLGGTSQRHVTDAHPDLTDLEYSIGYLSSYARHRIYQSHVWRHFTHGMQKNEDGRFFDGVIPMFYPIEEFPLGTSPEPYALFVGRLVPAKGLDVACQAAQKAGIPLNIIGHGDPALVTHGAHYLGVLPSKERNEIMSKASVLLSPTKYMEPFGSVAVEAQLCGTPVVSTDFGAFIETIEHGKTGYRCNYLGEFVKALKDAPSLDRNYIAARARRLYSIDTVKTQYAAYFERLALLWEKGWSSL